MQQPRVASPPEGFLSASLSRSRASRPLAAACHPPGALAALSLALALSTGCAEPRDDDLFGLHVEVRSTQAWASDPALRPRLRVLIEAACEHVGLDTSMLWGMTLRIVDGEIPCGAVPNARGCTIRDDGLVAVSTLAWTAARPPVPCVEDTPIPHELLHVKIGDPQHLDPRWDDPYYWTALSSRVEREDCSGDPASLTW